MAEEEKPAQSRLSALINLKPADLRSLRFQADETTPATTQPAQGAEQDQAASLRHQEL